MDIHVQDATYKDIGLIENYESLIWTERYAAHGDIEIKMPINIAHRDLISKAAYFTITDSDRTMLCETVSEDTAFTIKGRSLESILDRRVVETVGPPATNLTNLIYNLVEYNMGGLAPVAARRVTNMFVKDLVPPEHVVSTDYDPVKFGENLYTVVQRLCVSGNLGFKIINRSDARTITFYTYAGYELQNERIGRKNVIFSESLGNIQDLNSLRSSLPFKNVAVTNLPPWDDTPGVGEIWRVSNGDTPTGLNRREVWTDASDLRRDDTFSAANKPSRAVRWGRRELIDHPSVNDFDFKVAENNLFSYPEDYELGDQVRVITRDGLVVPHRVTEYIRSYGPEGFAEYPTLSAV